MRTHWPDGVPSLIQKVSEGTGPKSDICSRIGLPRGGNKFVSCRRFRYSRRRASTSSTKRALGDLESMFTAGRVLDVKTWLRRQERTKSYALMGSVPLNAQRRVGFAAEETASKRNLIKTNNTCVCAGFRDPLERACGGVLPCVQ
jgi:hypothetical protein